MSWSVWAGGELLAVARKIETYRKLQSSAGPRMPGPKQVLPGLNDVRQSQIESDRFSPKPCRDLPRVVRIAVKEEGESARRPTKD